MAKKPKAAAPTEKQTLITYKGFDANLRCRGFQYEIGGHYVHAGTVKACEGGFHSCEHPLNVFDYYAPAGNRFAEVEVSGAIDRDGSDTKIASAEITIKVELSISDLVQRAWEWVWGRTTLEDGASATGDQGAASATGDHSVACALGFESKAKAAVSGAIVLIARNQHWEGGEILDIVSAKVGTECRGVLIKPDVWYSLTKDGRVVEWGAG